MNPRFVLDEHLRGSLWKAFERHNATAELTIDVTCVGDEPDLPLGSSDPELLGWAERHARIVVTLDRQTLVGHFADQVTFVP